LKPPSLDLGASHYGGAMIPNKAITLICGAVLLLSCGKKDNEPKPPGPDGLAELASKRQTYLELSELQQGEAGFLEEFHCDSLLFSALYAVSGGNVQIQAARAESGQWFRTPAHDCFLRGKSDSTISKDMLLGLAIWHWQFRDFEGVVDLIEYGKTHNWGIGWKMGDGVLDRVVLLPGSQAYWLEARYRMGGTNDPNRLFQPGNGERTGFARHLQTLGIFFRGLMAGGVTDKQLERLRLNAASNLENAFYQAAYHFYFDGDQTAAIEILLSERYYPNRRLPTNRERCSPYPMQRDPGPDWEPCPNESLERYSGVGLIFTSAIILGKLRTI